MAKFVSQIIDFGSPLEEESSGYLQERVRNGIAVEKSLDELPRVKNSSGF
jgi:hypothetical protein